MSPGPTTARAAPDPWQVAFGLGAVLALVLIGLNGVLVVRPTVFAGVLDPAVVAGASAHFNTVEHRIHDLTFALLYTVGAVGLLSQLRRPRSNVAGALMALLPWVPLAVIFTVTSGQGAFGTRFPRWASTVFGGLALAAVLLHPAGPALLRSFARARVHRPLVLLSLLASVPLLALGKGNLDRQLLDDPTNIHWQIGHYGFMAAFAVTAVALALLASLRLPGCRLTAWAAGALPALLGVLSLANPGLDSSLSGAWAWAAIAWGGCFAFVAERDRDPAGAPAVPARSG